MTGFAQVNLNGVDAVSELFTTTLEPLAHGATIDYAAATRLMSAYAEKAAVALIEEDKVAAQKTQVPETHSSYKR